MTKKIPTSALRTKFKDCIERVADNGERLLVTRHGEVVAAMIPYADLQRLERYERGISTLYHLSGRVEDDDR